MELTCSRCQQTIQSGDCFCPGCGLPQLVYSTEGAAAQTQPEPASGPPRDANQVQWKPALRSAIALAIPTGLFCSLLSPVSVFGPLLMAGAGGWAVMLYLRGQAVRRVRLGAGARIGLAAGVLGSWTSAAVTGVTLFAMRSWLHQGGAIDSFWQTMTQQANQQWTTMGVDAQTMAIMNGLLHSPEGRAGWALGGIAFLMAALLVAAAAGGALSARFLARGTGS